MGNYEDHVRYGQVTYLLLDIALAGAVLSGGLSPFWGVGLAVLAYPFVRLGAAFPDVDHHASRPHHGLRRVMFYSGTVGSFFILYTNPFVSLESVVRPVSLAVGTEVQVAILVHAVSLLIGLSLREAVSYFRPKHRGVTHRVPTGLVIAGSIGALMWYTVMTVEVGSPLLVSGTAGGAFFAGFLSHLQCDEMLLPAVRNSIRGVGGVAQKLRRAVSR